ncbi:hypothetical protein C8T65DRAFT_55712 [Cerioporus squamosus]|nr:hypothetical protein C8T65DRAFT_55712 [Cerioporus squamosus]
MIESGCSSFKLGIGAVYVSINARTYAHTAQALVLYHEEAVAFTRQWRTRVSGYMHTILAALWIFTPFLSLPLFVYTPRRWFAAAIHSMLLAAAFPVVLCLLLEGGGLSAGPGSGLLALHDLPKAYAALAQGALKHFDIFIRLFEVVICILELVLRISKLFLHALRTTRLHLQSSIIASSVVGAPDEAPATGAATACRGGSTRWTILDVLEARVS